MAASGFPSRWWRDTTANEYGAWGTNGGCPISLKPSAALTISTGPHYNRSRGLTQYVQTGRRSRRRATYGSRYVFSDISQTQVTLTTRVNYILTPRAVAPGVHAAAPRDWRYTTSKSWPSRARSASSSTAPAQLARLRSVSRLVHGRSGWVWSGRRRSRSTIPTSTSSRCG